MQKLWVYFRFKKEARVSTPSTSSLIETAIEVFNPTPKRLHNLSNVPNLGQLVLQIINRGKD
jgi:hypothetical protein